MRNKKHIRVRDVFGRWFEVSEIRTTRHSFDVYLGRAEDRVKRRGIGRTGVILTKPLAKYLTRLRMRPWEIDLPICVSAVKNLRKRLGFHIRRDIRRWWEDRREDLVKLSRVEFAKLHGRNVGLVKYQGRSLVGSHIKPRFWWKAPDVQTVLFSGQPDAEIAAELAIAPSSVRRLRSQSQKTTPPN
jgi:hypothetical protein